MSGRRSAAASQTASVGSNAAIIGRIGAEPEVQRQHSAGFGGDAVAQTKSRSSW